MMPFLLINMIYKYEMSNESVKKGTASLILFDIDGTLMITKGASSRCIKRACQIVLGDNFAWHPVTVGTLDPQIFDQLAKANGITPTKAQQKQYESIYLDELKNELSRLKANITLLPGIRSLIDQLHHRAQETGDVVLGVLTGNFRKATEIKLNLSGLGLQRFPVIACAEHGNSRNDLPSIAIQMAIQQTGKLIDAAGTILIGDTPRDIECAKASGCQCVSVATGHYSTKQLKEAGGSVVIDNLLNPTPLLNLLDQCGKTL